MIIFLDLDGVVHEFDAPESEIFVYLPRIEAVLREHPFAKVVVCSDLRKLKPWKEILGRFARDIQPRVLGATPALPSPHLRGGFRYTEAMAYLERNGLDRDRWIALDDVASNWPPNDSRVILCHDEFGDREERLLREALR